MKIDDYWHKEQPHTWHHDTRQTFYSYRNRYSNDIAGVDAWVETIPDFHGGGYDAVVYDTVKDDAVLSKRFDNREEANDWLIAWLKKNIEITSIATHNGKMLYLVKKFDKIKKRYRYHVVYYTKDKIQDTPFFYKADADGWLMSFLERHPEWKIFE